MIKILEGTAIKTLTDEQADLFREIRRKVNQLTRDIDDIRSKTSSGCEHYNGDYVDDCPVCQLDIAIRDAGLAVQDAPRLVEDALLRGPMPKSHPSRSK